jgi:hypothetical protein
MQCGALFHEYTADAFRTNGGHQLDFQASSIAAAHLGLPVNFFDR